MTKKNGNQKRIRYEVFVAPTTGERVRVSWITSEEMMVALVTSFRESGMDKETWEKLDDEGQNLMVRGVINRCVAFLAHQGLIFLGREEFERGVEAWADLAEESGLTRDQIYKSESSEKRRNALAMLCPDDIQDKMSLWAFAVQNSGLRDMLEADESPIAHAVHEAFA